VGRGTDLLGFSVAFGDIDANGRDDMFLAASFADGPDNSYTDCGEIYLVFNPDTVATPVATTRRSTGRLMPAYPNPFSDSATFRFSVEVGVQISLTIYDVSGRRVATPMTSQMAVSGEQSVQWNGTDINGQHLASGIYFAKLKVGNESYSNKVFLVR
jgi:hypothetical protein